MSDLSEVFANELETVKAEDLGSQPMMADQEAEATIYDFDFWVVRDRPPYLV